MTPEQGQDYFNETSPTREPKPDGGPAYPSTVPFVAPPSHHQHHYKITDGVSTEHKLIVPFSFSGEQATESHLGMTLRDKAALAALPEIMRNAYAHNERIRKGLVNRDLVDFHTVEFDEMAEKAYVVADALIKARGN